MDLRTSSDTYVSLAGAETWVRLLLLAYCEVRVWAREVGEQERAEHSSELINNCAYGSRYKFLVAVDGLIFELEHYRVSIASSAPGIEGRCNSKSRR